MSFQSIELLLTKIGLVVKLSSLWVRYKKTAEDLDLQCYKVLPLTVSCFTLITEVIEQTKNGYLFHSFPTLAFFLCPTAVPNKEVSRYFAGNDDIWRMVRVQTFGELNSTAQFPL